MQEETTIVENTEVNVKDIIKNIELRMKQVPFRNEGERIGRNELCPCGSQVKFKKCCLLLKRR